MEVREPRAPHCHWQWLTLNQVGRSRLLRESFPASRLVVKPEYTNVSLTWHTLIIRAAVHITVPMDTTYRQAYKLQLK